MEKQSCNSMTSRSAAESPEVSYTCWAAARDMGHFDGVDAGAGGERLAGVGRHGLGDDLDGPVAQPVAFDEPFRYDDGGGRPVGGGRTLELGQRAVDGPGGEDLVDRVRVLELGVRIVHRVPVVLGADRRELRLGRPVPVHVFAGRVSEDLGGGRGHLEAVGGGHDPVVPGNGRRPEVGGAAVGSATAQCPARHLLESEREHAVADAALDELAGHHQSGGAGRTVVVDVVDGYAGRSEFVHGALVEAVEAWKQ